MRIASRRRALVDRILVGSASLALLSALACSGPGTGDAAPALIHLTDLLGEAGAGTPASAASGPEGLEWSFAEPRPEWHAATDRPGGPPLSPVRTTPLGDALRLEFLPSGFGEAGFVYAAWQVDLPPEPERHAAEFDQLALRARCRGRLGGIAVAWNVEEDGAIPHPRTFFQGSGRAQPVFSDGSEQTYLLPLAPRPDGGQDAVLRNLALLAVGPEPAALEVLSIRLVPRGAEFAASPGERPVTRDGVTRETLHLRAPGKVALRVTLPAAARLDLGLSTLPGDTVTARIRVVPADGPASTVLEEEIADGEVWAQRQVDLAAWAGRRVEIELAAEAARPGAVALFGAPVLSGAGAAGKPDVVFYVIDGAGADLMSAWGYNRRTTPNLERLAAEGTLFEHAYSNSTWTQSSTASFMTSLHHSVLGGLRRGIHSTPVPKAATTMAEHFRRAGYQTSVFTSNPNAGRAIGLERGVDWMRDTDTEHHSTSSRDLHEEFWSHRDVYPGRPSWTHFQTTDVHELNEPSPPFSGLFVGKAERDRLAELDERLWGAMEADFGSAGIVELYDRGFERTQIDRGEYYEIRRGLYDETMAHQDHQLGAFVERLKRSGRWQNTLLIIASDHGHPAGTFARFGRGQFDPQPEPWQGALLDAYSTRIPLLFVWPGKIRAGQRIADPVSMIDVLPSLLDLLDLPRPEILQGQSLAPLLRGEAMEVRPVIFDEFRVDAASGEMVGNLEILDGRWGASLEIGPLSAGADPALGRHEVPAGGRWGAHHRWFPEVPRLLLYDVWNDPFARHAVNDQHPDRVRHYHRLLLQYWEAHQALAGRFGEAAEVALDARQLEQLKALGYLQ